MRSEPPWATGTISWPSVDGALFQAVAADQWNLATPCAAWDVRRLVNHVTGENAWAVPLLDGRTIHSVGDELDGDLLGDDPGRSWDKWAAAALDADVPDEEFVVARLRAAGARRAAWGWPRSRSTRTVPPSTCSRRRAPLRAARRALTPVVATTRPDRQEQRGGTIAERAADAAATPPAKAGKPVKNSRFRRTTSCPAGFYSRSA